MGTSVRGQPPFSPSDVQPRADGLQTFGSGGGGTNIAPNQGVPAVGAILYALLQRVATAAANVAALQATLQADRANGQLVITLDTYTLWVWQNANTAAASASIIEPTDTSAGANAGAGRWVELVSGGAGGSAAVQEADIALTAAGVAAKGSVLTGTFAGSVLPAGARIVAALVDITTEFSGPSTLTVELGDGTTATKYMGATSLEQVAGEYSTAGSATFNGQNVGGVTPTVTVTATGSNLSTVSAGAAIVKLFYFVEA